MGDGAPALVRGCPHTLSSCRCKCKCKTRAHSQAQTEAPWACRGSDPPPSAGPPEALQAPPCSPDGFPRSSSHNSSSSSNNKWGAWARVPPRRCRQDLLQVQKEISRLLFLPDRRPQGVCLCPEEWGCPQGSLWSPMGLQLHLERQQRQLLGGVCCLFLFLFPQGLRERETETE